MKSISIKNAFRALLACILTIGCTTVNEYDALDGSCGPAVIYPDYKGITIPSNIAPLNFHYAMKDAAKASTTFTLGDRTVRLRGTEVEWNLRKWKHFIEGSEGQTIKVSAEVKVGGRQVTDSWEIYVSGDKLAPYLTYRLIEPSFQMFHELSMKERCIENFDETTICDHTVTDNSCMNCHMHAQSRGDLSLFYIRGPKGGAILNRDGSLRKLNLKTDGMLSSTVYGEIHPSGRFGVFSTNIILPSLHTLASERLEVYDSSSDLTVADFDNNKMINAPHVARADKLETFPCFSADGDFVFYCVADTVSLPGHIAELNYSLVKAAFDSATGVISEQTEVLWDANVQEGSVCHPKASPDGKWLMFTIAGYGTFPVGHRETRLVMLNLETGELNSLEGIKSDDSGSDSYHSWSSDSRWFVFASKRGDGQFAKPYFCHLDEEGRPSKPFVLPQRSSRFYEFNLKSFNIPDLGDASIGITRSDSRKLFHSPSEAFE